MRVLHVNRCKELLRAFVSNTCPFKWVDQSIKYLATHIISIVAMVIRVEYFIKVCILKPNVYN